MFFSSMCLPRTIYEKLAEAVSDDAKDIYLQRSDEISPNIRYCSYNIGDETAVEDLMKMRWKIGQEDPLISRLDVSLVFRVHSETLWKSRFRFLPFASRYYL